MKALFVQPDIPYPCHAGAHFRDLQHLQLARKIGFETHLLYASARPEAERQVGEEFFKSQGVISHWAGSRLEPQEFTKFELCTKKIKYLLCGLPGFGSYWASRMSDFPFSFLYDAMGFKDRLVEAVQHLKPQGVILRCYFMHFIPHLRKTGMKIIVDCPDITEIIAMELLKSIPGLFGRLGPLCHWVAQRQQDRLFLPMADEIWVTSLSEKEFLERKYSLRSVICVPNLLEIPKDFSVSISPPQPTLLLVANFWFGPYQKAASLLLNRIFPKISEAIPHARLWLVGRGLSEDLLRMARQNPNIECPGFVEDLNPFYQNASIVLLPIREKGGVLIKLIEALAYGKPIVAFPKAIEGSGLQAGENVLLVDGPEQMADKTIQLLQDKNLRTELGIQNRLFFEKHFSYSSGLEILLTQTILGRILNGFVS